MSENMLFNSEIKSVAIMPKANNTDGVTITSLEIADLTGKRHDSVLRDIETQLGKIRDVPKFVGIYKDVYGRDKKCYCLPKTEALILVSGYSVELREKIILRLEFLENEFKKQSTPTLPKTYAEALLEAGRLALELEKSQAQIIAQKPKVEYAEAILSAKNSLSIGDFAKMLCGKGINIGQNRFFEWLRNNHYLQSDNLPYQKFMDCGYFELLPQSYTKGGMTLTRYKVLITPKGQQYFTMKFKRGF